MLSSWVMQAGFDPPMLTVAVRQDRFVAEWLSQGLPFVLNVLGQQQKGMLSHFGRGFAPEEPAFDGLAIEHTASGLPMIAGAVGHLECQPMNHLDSGDHRIFLAEVVGGDLQTEEGPMVHIRKSGLHY